MTALSLIMLAGTPVLAQADRPAATPAPQTAAAATSAEPGLRGATAIVNGAIITGTDIDQRLAIVLAANDSELAPAEQAQLRNQIQSNLIDEMLQIQEANAADVAVSDAEVEATYNRVSQQNFNMPSDRLDAYLATIGSSPQSMKQQIRGELSWQRLLRRNIAPFINVSADEVQERLDRLQADKGTEEYRLGEIFLSANSENSAQVRERALQIAQQLQQGGSFVAYARQYSEASSAAVGGDLGWVRLGALPPELATSASQMQTGQLLGPIELAGGYSLMYLIDKRQVLVADPRDAVLSLKQISISFPAGAKQQDATARASRFAEGVQDLGGCDRAEQGAAALGAQIVSNEGVRVRDLPAPLQEAMLSLPIGGVSPPFGSIEEGVRVLMVCGRSDPAASSGPSAEQLMAQIEDERVNKRAQTYLRDLRRDAIIEYN
ncbi:peptidylprolyl isomerase [Croceicoccus sp. F390]|uniref:Parvulin-like PPIase n=1 Tax=Croceicoccus esteveae TaxID=3075597 RepID=A0ABU2ZFM2_9SPHN|nr:peptidylprolyl isomerase [Croceicoccus sp. F390]MDT0575383.1 peptidylprolyl isomerase [Croceicoccus sp. F390]